MLYIADHVLNGRRDDEPVGLRLKCEEALQGFLGYAESFGCADLVDQPDEAVFNFTEAMPEEPGVSEAINDYDEDTFWQELVTRLAERDYERNNGRPLCPIPRALPRRPSSARTAMRAQGTRGGLLEGVRGGRREESRGDQGRLRPSLVRRLFSPGGVRLVISDHVNYWLT
jgi:hypothetical protein